MKKRELPINDLLYATDHCKGDWLSQQTEAARKDFTPIPFLRWVSTVNDGPEAAYMLWIVNERANGHCFELSAKHPDLMYRLLASCGLDRTLRHNWLAGPTRRRQNNAAANLLLEQFPDASDLELDVLLSQFDRQGFSEFLDECGLQTTDPNDVARAQEAMKSYDKMFPEQTKQGAKGKTTK